MVELAGLHSDIVMDHDGLIRAAALEALGALHALDRHRKEHGRHLACEDSEFPPSRGYGAAGAGQGQPRRRLVIFIISSGMLSQQSAIANVPLQ